MASKGHQFDEQSARRITRTVQAYEASAEPLWTPPVPGDPIGGDTLWRRFELKEDLAGAGTTAVAYLLDEEGTRTEEEFDVWDLFVGFTGDGSTESGADGSEEGTGNKGWAMYRSDSEKWEVVQLNC